MTLPTPHAGLVIRYAYLWWREFEEGREDKDKGPSLCDRADDGRDRRRNPCDDLQGPAAQERAAIRMGEVELGQTTTLSFVGAMGGEVGAPGAARVPYLPVQRGSRFSAKARAPSFMSSLL